MRKSLAYLLAFQFCLEDLFLLVQGAESVDSVLVFPANFNFFAFFFLGELSHIQYSSFIADASTYHASVHYCGHV